MCRVRPEHLGLRQPPAIPPSTSQYACRPSRPEGCVDGPSSVRAACGGWGPRCPSAIQWVQQQDAASRGVLCQLRVQVPIGDGSLLRAVRYDAAWRLSRAVECNPQSRRDRRTRDAD